MEFSRKLFAVASTTRTLLSLKKSTSYKIYITHPSCVKFSHCELIEAGFSWNAIEFSCLALDLEVSLKFCLSFSSWTKLKRWIVYARYPLVKSLLKIVTYNNAFTMNFWVLFLLKIALEVFNITHPKKRFLYSSFWCNFYGAPPGLHLGDVFIRCGGKN